MGLRRAVETVTLGFSERLKSEEVQVWGCLQEISRNPDTQALAFYEKEVPGARGLLKDSEEGGGSANLVARGYGGSKKMNTTGLMRLREFPQKLLKEPKSHPEEVVVVGGHSLWFKLFFDLHLPYGADEGLPLRARTRKIKNGGA